MSHHYTLAATLALLGLLVVLPAPAEARERQTQTEATFLSYDPDAHTITVEVRKAGKRKGPKLPKHMRLKRGDEAVFNVKEEGSVLTATIAKSTEGTRMAIEELRPGTKVFVFWVLDGKDENARFARSISVYVAAQDWKGAVDDDAPAAPAD